MGSAIAFTQAPKKNLHDNPVVGWLFAFSLLFFALFLPRNLWHKFWSFLIWSRVVFRMVAWSRKGCLRKPTAFFVNTLLAYSQVRRC